MGIQLGLTNIRDEHSSQPQQLSNINNLQPPSGIINNRSFDPYAANNNAAHNNTIGNSGRKINYNR